MKLHRAIGIRLDRATARGKGKVDFRQRQAVARSAEYQSRISARDGVRLTDFDL